MEWTYGRIVAFIAFLFGIAVACYFIFFKPKHKKDIILYDQEPQHLPQHQEQQHEQPQQQHEGK